MKKFSRGEKINLLNTIKNGGMTLDVLNKGKFNIFFQVGSNPLLYECLGKTYTENELRTRCEELTRSEQRFLIWHEEKSYELKDN